MEIGLPGAGTVPPYPPPALPGCFFSPAVRLASLPPPRYRLNNGNDLLVRAARRRARAGDAAFCAPRPATPWRGNLPASEAARDRNNGGRGPLSRPPAPDRGPRARRGAAATLATGGSPQPLLPAVGQGVSSSPRAPHWRPRRRPRGARGSPTLAGPGGRAAQRAARSDGTGERRNTHSPRWPARPRRRSPAAECHRAGRREKSRCGPRSWCKSRPFPPGRRAG